MYKIMLVDPNQSSREKMRKLLNYQHFGFDLQDYAETQRSALELFRKRLYALIIVNMSQLNDEGLQVCENIRKESQIPIILMGGSKNFQLVKKALTLQINDYLPDPIEPDEFKTCLSSIKQKLQNSSNDQWKNMLLKRSMKTKPPCKIIEKVKAYVEESIGEDISLKEISNKLNYNSSYLGQKFKAHEKMTFKQYLLHCRMEKAMYLLDNTTLKIYEVAHEVGYKELDWFYQKFKAHTGISASEYRKL
ncbi:helix-turn-helix domain-containing protein [Bacillus alkalicellulosilyticus]|uniref:helix-turn-helix domain-containing protein n=1 Tax=Alkalihalobacterium alkalicellulosilyticum TaxID=1912214 RepID=UPI001481ED4F|nr:helix-turn-helix domain-containing protein [Bacillus alkalicellulosilyticus]